MKVLRVRGVWENALSLRRNSAVAQALSEYMTMQRWYRDKTRPQKSVTVQDVIPLGPSLRLLIVGVEFISGEPSRYCVTVAFEVCADEPQTAIVEIHAADAHGFLTCATKYSEVALALLALIETGAILRGKSMVLVGYPAPEWIAKQPRVPSSGRVIDGDQTNTSYVYGESFVLKLLRKMEPGQSQEVEVLSQLGKTAFAHAPRLLGHLELGGEGGSRATLGILQEFVKNQGDAWGLAVRAATQFSRHAAGLDRATALPRTSLLELQGLEPPQEIATRLGDFLPLVELLGRRTAELHVALSTEAALSSADDLEFRRVMLGPGSELDFYRSTRQLAARALDSIRASQKDLREGDQELAHEVLHGEGQLLARLRALCTRPLAGSMIRVHGDFHLGQVLYTGNDFVFVDYEGEPARPAEQRRRKRSPMADVAGMLRSFDYAAHEGMKAQNSGVIGEAQCVNLSACAEAWQAWVGARYLHWYLRTIERAELLPQEADALKLLLDAHLLEKTLYEVVYELGNRPAWVGVPLRALLSLVK